MPKRVCTPQGVWQYTLGCQVFTLNCSLRFKIAEEGVHSPRGVAVHPGLGRVYWTDWDRYRPAIEMANMDGTGRQV